MIKPILKIELPEGAEQEHIDKISYNLKDSSAAQDYHIIIITGKSDYINIEIIIAPDSSLHKP